MAASILFDQVGIPAGVAGQARTDGLDTGAVVTVTNASGQACRCEFWWKPPDDATAALVQNLPNQWEFTPTASNHGEYIVRMIEAEGTANETEDIKVFGIRLPNSGLLITGLNSRGDTAINLSSTAAEKTAAAIISFNNEPLTEDPTITWSNWWGAMSELFGVVEGLSGGGLIGGDVGAVDGGIPRADGIGGFTLQASDVVINDNNVVSGARRITLTANIPELVWQDTDQPAEEERWGFIAQSGSFRGKVLSDDELTEDIWMQVSRGTGAGQVAGITWDASVHTFTGGIVSAQIGLQTNESNLVSPVGSQEHTLDTAVATSGGTEVLSWALSDGFWYSGTILVLCKEETTNDLFRKTIQYEAYRDGAGAVIENQVNIYETAGADQIAVLTESVDNLVLTVTNNDATNTCAAEVHVGALVQTIPVPT